MAAACIVPPPRRRASPSTRQIGGVYSLHSATLRSGHKPVLPRLKGGGTIYAAVTLPPEYDGLEGCAALGGLSTMGFPTVLVLGVNAVTRNVPKKKRIKNHTAKNGCIITKFTI
jgi:hypothetical protein